MKSNRYTLRALALLLGYPNAKLCANVTQLLEEEVNNNVKPVEVDAEIRKELEKRLAGRPALVWPASSMAIDDKEQIGRASCRERV